MSGEILTPSLLLHAYAQGYFPMAESRDARELFWVDPDMRGIIPLDGLRISRRLARTIRQDRFRVTVNRDFAGVMAACAAPAPNRQDTWINDDILRLYNKLHEMGFAHSLECWRDDELVGGLYGVCMQAAFFGESMFSRMRDASKVALAHLVARMRAGGFRLLDTQFVTDHLKSLGAVEIPREQYHVLLAEALSQDADFFYWPDEVSGATVLQSITQTS